MTPAVPDVRKCIATFSVLESTHDAKVDKRKRVVLHVTF